MTDHVDATSGGPSAPGPIEPVWLVEATYAPDAAETRVPFRAEHIARLRDLKRQGIVVEAGAFADVTASIIVLRAADEQAALEVCAMTSTSGTACGWSSERGPSGGSRTVDPDDPQGRGFLGGSDDDDRREALGAQRLDDPRSVAASVPPGDAFQVPVDDVCRNRPARPAAVLCMDLVARQGEDDGRRSDASGRGEAEERAARVPLDARRVDDDEPADRQPPGDLAMEDREGRPRRVLIRRVAADRRSKRIG